MLPINCSQRITTAAALDNFFLFTGVDPPPYGPWQNPVFLPSSKLDLFDNYHRLQQLIERDEATFGRGIDSANGAGTNNGVGILKWGKLSMIMLISAIIAIRLAPAMATNLLAQLIMETRA
jgi:hypothetical protein